MGRVAGREGGRAASAPPIPLKPAARENNYPWARRPHRKTHTQKQQQQELKKELQSPSLVLGVLPPP